MCGLSRGLYEFCSCPFCSFFRVLRLAGATYCTVIYCFVLFRLPFCFRFLDTFGCADNNWCSGTSAQSCHIWLSELGFVQTSLKHLSIKAALPEHPKRPFLHRGNNVGFRRRLRRRRTLQAQTACTWSGSNQDHAMAAALSEGSVL